jgi:hypothetical protein
MDYRPTDAGVPPLLGSDRRRAARTCAACKALKSTCEAPFEDAACWRCTRLGLPCEFLVMDLFLRSGASPGASLSPAITLSSATLGTSTPLSPTTGTTTGGDHRADAREGRGASARGGEGTLGGTLGGTLWGGPFGPAQDQPLRRQPTLRATKRPALPLPLAELQEMHRMAAAPTGNPAMACHVILLTGASGESPFYYGRK